jgi:peptidoglycan hydrolase-like protein with peptidoglycan-binding domain
MSDFAYTNAQFRSILNGLGFRNRGRNEPDYPISADESSLDNDRQAVINFQDYFNLKVDGIVGPQTRSTAKQEIFVIQYALDLVMKPEPRLRSQNAPFYGPQTSLVIGDFRERYGLEPDGNANDDRMADINVRRKLDNLVPHARFEAAALKVECR